jgi:hypothetical protein
LEPVCPYCGLDLRASEVQQHWPQTHRYKAWGSNGIYPALIFINVLGAALMIAAGVVLFPDPRQRGVTLMLIAMWVAVMAFIVWFATSQVARSSITLASDRVEWTTVFGKGGSCTNAELAERGWTQSGKGFSFGVKGGPTCRLGSAIENFDGIASEIKRRVDAK